MRIPQLGGNTTDKLDSNLPPIIEQYFIFSSIIPFIGCKRLLSKTQLLQAMQMHHTMIDFKTQPCHTLPFPSIRRKGHEITPPQSSRSHKNNDRRICVTQESVNAPPKILIFPISPSYSPARRIWAVYSSRWRCRDVTHPLQEVHIMPSTCPSRAQ